MFKSIWGLFGVLVLKGTAIPNGWPETARRKRSIGDSGALGAFWGTTWDTFDLVVFNFILVPFSALV